MNIFRQLYQAGLYVRGLDIKTRGELSVSGIFSRKRIAPAEITTAGAATYTIAQMLAGLIRRDPNGADRSDVTPSALLLVAAFKTPYVGLGFSFDVWNTSDAMTGEKITVTAGGDCTLEPTAITIARDERKRFICEITNIGSGTEAYTIYEVGVSVVLDPVLTQVDSSALYTVGRRYTDVDGNVFIYLEGVSSLITGNWVSYRITSAAAAVTVRVTAGAQGTLAIAMAAVTNGKFGWFQIFGNNLGAGAIGGGDALAGGAVYLTSTASLMDDVEVADDRVSGAVFSIKEGELSSNPVALAGVTISYPFVGMGWPVRPNLSQIDNSALYSVGRTYRDETNGDEWIYLSGVGSCVEGSWLTYYITSIAASVTALIAASALGLVAVSVGANESGKFGWAQIKGNNLRAKAASGGDAAAGAHVYYQAAGICDDQIVTGDMVYGAIWSIQEGNLAGNPAGLAGVTLHYPFVTNEST